MARELLSFDQKDDREVIMFDCSPQEPCFEDFMKWVIVKIEK